MPDLIADLLPLLKAPRFSDLELGEQFVYPHYQGYSLLNIPAGICKLLGVPGLGAMPLAGEYIGGWGKEFKRVILLLMDGLGLNLFQRYLAEGLGRVWTGLLPGALLAPLTSIVPSTTSAALTTLWTGVSPAEHGITGYELWLKEYGVVANMILHSAASFNNDIGGLKRSSFQPETFLPNRTLGPHLHDYGIASYAFMYQAIARSGLSTMHLRQANVYPFRNPADLWVSLRQLLEDRAGERFYTYAYWGDLDELSHRYGPDDERVAMEFDVFSRIFETSFLNRLSAVARQDTLLIMTADHGLIHTPRAVRFELRQHPILWETLAIQPTGESRTTYLHVRPGQVKTAAGYFEETWPGEFRLKPSWKVVQSGLLGSGNHHPRLMDRVGDLMAFAVSNGYLWWAEKENSLLGRHGGLTPQEMLVPFYAVAL
jgi:predicted AlkP superfamily pyrophosphatase or phosphodiesterase